MRISVAEKAANYVLLIGFSLFAIAPVAGIFSTALSPQNGVAEGGPHWRNFLDAWRIGRFDEALLNSALIAALVVGVAIGAFIVMVMKGPAYVADAYPMQGMDRPDVPLPPGPNPP